MAREEATGRPCREVLLPRRSMLSSYSVASATYVSVVTLQCLNKQLRRFGTGHLGTRSPLRLGRLFLE
jgi:hypothetical protein